MYNVRSYNSLFWVFGVPAQSCDNWRILLPPPSPPTETVHLYSNTHVTYDSDMTPLPRPSLSTSPDLPTHKEGRMRNDVETISTRWRCLYIVAGMGDVSLRDSRACWPCWECRKLQAASESEGERWDFKFFPNFTSFVMLEIIMKTSSGLGTGTYSQSM